MTQQDPCPTGSATPVGQRVPASTALLGDGSISSRSLAGALAEAGRVQRPVAQVMLAEGLVPPQRMLEAMAREHAALCLTRADNPPDPVAMRLLPASVCIEHGILPWLWIGDTLVLATARPDRFEEAKAALPDGCGPVMMAVCLETDIHDAIAGLHGAQLAAAAEQTRDAAHSCRDLNKAGTAGTALATGLAALCGLALWFAPSTFFAAALTLALASLLVSQLLRVAALFASIGAPRLTPMACAPRLPRVSMLVPLFREEDIAGALVSRLNRLTYPKSLLEVLLILEQDDDTTAAALSRTALPPWFRTVRVPSGTVQTKPRALNYALTFARGEIIGIWDAEDAPAPDQIDRVVDHFARAPPRVGCVQGILDFYNPRANWLSRCFAIEYASWFRLLLPGLARLGFVLPLGGTTVFLRRSVLEKTGGWDAHNVTEDADLGILLARKGFVTDVLPTVTREEANNHLWPWIKQRSRWLKGYAITWWVHSRRPAALWRDLGGARFLGVQALMLATVLQFMLAPLLWSFWLILFGLPHPLDGWLSPEMRMVLLAAFLSAEGVSILTGLVAVARSPHRGLLPWVPTLFAYFPLATVALYKGIWEILWRPFYWDKTQHGRSGPDAPDADLPPDR